MKSVKQTQLSLATPDPFHFAHTAYSHGWSVLAPTSWDAAHEQLSRVERLSGGQVVRLAMRTDGNGDIGVEISHVEPLNSAELAEIRGTVHHMFRLDEDLTGFYELCRAKGGRWLFVTAGLGRLLRSPTIFEDVVKTICTTNIQWGGTKRMVAELVRALGEPFPGDPSQRAFPAPAAIAALSPDQFAAAVRLGYRAPYVHLLARQVAGGELDLDALADPELPTPVLRKRLLAIKGVGGYAAATLLMLLGRYDELAVDTVFRQFVSQHYFGGERPSDQEAMAIYDDWGPWKYLAFWFDVWDAPDL